jgi:hypothetical protein
MKKAEREHLNKVAELGCIVCGDAAEIHRPRFSCGMAQRAPHWLAIPLCYEHHRGSLSIHNDKKQFEALFGAEPDLLAATIERLALSR